MRPLPCTMLDPAAGVNPPRVVIGDRAVWSGHVSGALRALRHGGSANSRSGQESVVPTVGAEPTTSCGGA